MNPGELKQRLIFEQEKGKDESGYPIPGKKEYARAWGALKTLKGETKFVAAQSQMQHVREFTIRYQSKLDVLERPDNLTVKWRGMDHEIESIEDVDGLHKEMTVLLKAVS